MIGQRIGHYQVIDKLGEGGMGVVYKARDLKLDRLVALKVLPPAMSHNAERRARFLQEARAASALNHPHIVTIHHFLTEGESDVIVMSSSTGRRWISRFRHEECDWEKRCAWPRKSLMRWPRRMARQSCIET